MLKRAFKVVTTAFIVALPTLVIPLVNAPGASASTNLGVFKGLAYSHVEWSSTGARKDVTLSVTDVTPASTPADQTSDWQYSPGTSLTMRLEWSESGSPPATIQPFEIATISVHSRNGNQMIGSNKFITFSAAEKSAKLATFTMVLDKVPFNGIDDADLLSQIRVDFGISPLNDCSPNNNCLLYMYSADAGGLNYTVGNVANIPSASSFASALFSSAGSLLGWQEQSNSLSTMRTNESTIKDSSYDIPVVRHFASDWSRPSSGVLDMMDGSTTGSNNEHRIVLWSNRPPQDPNLHNNPRWSLIDSTHDSAGAWGPGLDEVLRDLQTAATNGDTQAIYTFSHEPHDEDDAQNGSKCTYDDTRSSSSWDPCYGTPAQYRAAYAHIRDRLDVACGTSPSYGQPCDRVLLSYTPVPSNADDDIGTGIGSGDAFRPADDDFDLLTPDPYNWFCYQGSNGAGCNDISDWEDMSEIMASSVSLAQVHNKQLLFAEVGSHPGCPNGTSDPDCNLTGKVVSGSGIGSPSRDDWFHEAALWLSSNADAKQWIIGFCYYHSASNNDWQFVNTGSPRFGLTGYQDGFINNNATWNGNNAAYFIKGVHSDSRAPVWIPSNH